MFAGPGLWECLCFRLSSMFYISTNSISTLLDSYTLCVSTFYEFPKSFLRDWNLYIL